MSSPAKPPAAPSDASVRPRGELRATAGALRAIRPAPADPARPGLLALARLGWEFQRDPLGCFESLSARLGQTVVFARPRFGSGPARPLVVTTQRPLVRAILTDSRFRNSSLALSGPRGSAHRRLRHSLFRLHGEEHRRHRRVIAPTLHRRAVAAHRDTIVRVVDRALRGWEPGQQRDLAADMKRLARDVAATALFGVHDSEEAARTGAMIEDWWSDNFRARTRLVAHDLPGTPYRAMLRKADALERRVREIIERKRAGGSAGHDMLSGMIRASRSGDGLSEEELLGETHILFLAAHETTAYALTWTLFLLAQHPRIAQALCEELDAALAGAAPRVDDLPRLPQLGRVIDESLRILPVIPFGARIAAEPVTVEGLDLPRKARILIPFHLLHRDPDVFAEPSRFDPDRWVGFEPPPWSYLPFGGGLHMCPGMSFARLTLQLTLSIVLQRFRLRVREGARIDRRVTVTLSPRHGMPVEVLAPDAAWRRSPVRGDIHRMVDLRDPRA